MYIIKIWEFETQVKNWYLVKLVNCAITVELHALFIPVFSLVKELHQELLEVLHKQIYIKSTSGVVKDFQRQGSLRQSKKERDKTSLIKVIATSHMSQGAQEQSREFEIVISIYLYVHYAHANI